MGKLSELGKISIPQVHLSATIPPHLQSAYMKKQYLGEETVVIRKSTERPEIAYIVDRPGKVHSTHEYTKQKAKELEENYFTPESRGIIFVRNREAAESLADRIGGTFYHSMMTKEDREKNYNDWYSGKFKWMVATSGFINGVDHPFVTAVIFLEIPHGFLDFFQGSGRGGRSGLLSITLLITTFDPKMKDEDGWKCADLLIQWAKQTDECRRVGISAVMDGESRSCSDIKDAELCDVCKSPKKSTASSSQSTTASVQPIATLKSSSPANSSQSMSSFVRHTKAVVAPPQPVFRPSRVAAASGSQAPQASAKQPMSQMERRAALINADTQLKGDLMKQIGDHASDFASKHCIICFLLMGKMVPKEKHNYFFHCKIDDLTDSDWFSFKRRCRLPLNNTYCLYCWFPQKAPHKLPYHTSDSYGSGNACNLRNLASVVVYAVYRNPLWNARICERFPAIAQCNDDQQYADWLVSENSPSGFINAFHLFLEVMKMQSNM